jgi:hypothetical protein
LTYVYSVGKESLAMSTDAVFPLFVEWFRDG